jgi:hypothetical protein
MKVGKIQQFYLFGSLVEGVVTKVNKDKSIDVSMEGVNYPGIKTFTTLPKKAKEIPPWYILKINNKNKRSN